MSNNKKDLASMIDQLMMQGNGHVNIKVNEDNDSINVETTNSTECQAIGACMQPNEKMEEN